ncbi:MAG: NHL repeat-containing protein [Hyphococcus sp.]
MTKLWQLTGPFTSPESAIYDEKRDVIYVSNVAGYTENGLGYISAVGLDGALKNARWLEGVNAPTGMAISGDTLYAADFNRLLEIDIPSATVQAVYDAPHDNPGLNDATISLAGDVFVSASAISTIYRLEDGALKTWASGDALQYANGVFADDQYLYVAAYYLRRIDLETRKIEPFGDNEQLIDLESIETDGRGGFFVTRIGEKPIAHVSAEGVVTDILERAVFTVDIDYIADQKILLAPSSGDALAAFSVE